jgi:hypothetical protein
MKQNQKMNIISLTLTQNSTNVSVTDYSGLILNPESEKYTNIIAFSEFTYV